jgi:hypothetical protein
MLGKAALPADSAAVVPAVRHRNELMFYCAWCERMHAHTLDREDLKDDLVPVPGRCTNKRSPYREGCFLRVESASQEA